jgi:outer membrane biosynthesis protein TonB
MFPIPYFLLFMPYELETEKLKLSHKFLNATQIAILLSVGLHFLLYKYGFPTLLIQEKLNNRDKTVATVELSPVEQARLPDLESSWNVPLLNSTSLDEAAPPFALPLPPNFNPSTNLPPVPIPPGYNFPNLPSINSNNIELPPLGITDLSELPLPPPIEDLNSLTPPDVPLTTPEKPPNSKPTTEKPPTPKPPEVKAPEEKTEETKPTPQQIAAVQQQKLQGNLRNVSSSLRQQNTATTDEEARKNYINWLSKIEDAKPETVKLQGIYPRDACIRKLEDESVYGVLINAKNEVVGLELIKGAKYPIFNEQASEDIQKHDFANESKKTKPYQVTVNYEYNRETCPSLTLPSLKEKEQPAPVTTPEPQPEVEQAPEPVTTPEPQPEVEQPPKPVTTPEPQPEVEQPPKPVTTPEPQPEVEPKPVPEHEPEAEQKPEPQPEAEQQPSLRERLENTPLPDNETIRERLQKNPLPGKKE